MHIIPPLSISGQCTLGMLEPAVQYPMIPNGLQTTGPFGRIITRKLQGDGFILWHQHLVIEKATHLYAVTDTPAFFIHYMINGTPVVPSNGQHPFLLHEKTYRLLYLPEMKQEVQFAIGNYQSLQIELTSGYLERFSNGYPSLKRLLDSTRNNKTQLKHLKPGKIDTTMQGMINKLTHPGNMPATMQNSDLVPQLLLTYFKERGKTPVKSPYDTEDKELMSEIKQAIDSSLNQKLDVAQLAGNFGFTQATLQRRFCQFFKQTIFSYYTGKRLDMAMDLILEGNLKLREICHKIGYSHTNDFSRAFKKQFGHPPLYYKKKQQLQYLLKYLNEQ